MMLSQAIERPIIVASLSGRTLESLTIDNLIWSSVLDYLGIKEDIMEIPGKIRVSTNNPDQCQNFMFGCIFYIFLIFINFVIWSVDLVTELVRIIITMVCVVLMIFTFFKCMLLHCYCLENQEDIKDRVIAEFNEKCKFHQVSHCFFSLSNFLVLSLHHSNHFIKSQILVVLKFLFSIPSNLKSYTWGRNVWVLVIFGWQPI